MPPDPNPGHVDDVYGDYTSPRGAHTSTGTALLPQAIRWAAGQQPGWPLSESCCSEWPALPHSPCEQPGPAAYCASAVRCQLFPYLL